MRLEAKYVYDYEKLLNLTKIEKRNLAAIREFQAVKWFAEACELSEG